MMKLDSLQKLYVHELKDLYSAEMQLLEALPQVCTAANNDDLKEVFTSHLAQGKTQSAKDVLTANTNLTSLQVNDVVGGVEEDVSRTIQRYHNEASQAVEVASTYTQAVLWSVFLASAMGLAISLLGGCVDTEATRTIDVVRRRKLA